jgi:uncharacterized membrane protein YesL
MKFNFDNPFFAALGKIIDCAWVSILFLVCSIPLITIGASASALYYTVHKSIRGGRGYVARSFFSAFRKNFKQGTLAWLVWLLITLVLVADVCIMQSVPLLMYFFVVMLVIAIMWGCYLSPYVARFENTARQTLQNAFLMMVTHPLWSIVLLVLTAAGVFLTWLLPVLIILLPAIEFLLFDCVLERIFRTYMSAEDLAREQELDLLDKLE